MCFFFKQKTAYEMRISDWSSDVCSSDLASPSRSERSPRRVPPRRHRQEPLQDGQASSDAGPGSCRLKLTKAAVALRSCSQLLSRTPFLNAIHQARSPGLLSEIAKPYTKGHTAGRGKAQMFCYRVEMLIRTLAHFIKDKKNLK